MKTFLLAFALIAPASGFSQAYSIDWYKIAGGGGTSTNGQYAVTGTIGQPDAGGAMTGGNYSLTGGFLGADFRRANGRRADALHQPFRQHGDGVLAERFRLELVSERRSGQSQRLVGQRRSGAAVQRHEFPEHPVAGWEIVFPPAAPSELERRLATDATVKSGKMSLGPPPLDLELGRGVRERGVNVRGLLVADFFGQPRFGQLAGFLGLGLVNVVGLDGHVGENGHAVAGHLHKTVAYGEKNRVLRPFAR